MFVIVKFFFHKSIHIYSTFVVGEQYFCYSEILLYWNFTVIDFFFFSDYDSFLVYSRVVRIDTINMLNEFNRNAPFESIQSKDFMRNAIGLSFDYDRKKIFYSDIQRGSINSVYFNGSGHIPIVES